MMAYAAVILNLISGLSDFVGNLSWSGTTSTPRTDRKGFTTDTHTAATGQACDAFVIRQGFTRSGENGIAEGSVQFGLKVFARQ